MIQQRDGMPVCVPTVPEAIPVFRFCGDSGLQTACYKSLNVRNGGIDIMFRRVLLLALSAIALSSVVRAADPMATDYPPRDCEGSLTPYRVPEKEVVVPDSLSPVFINHVGRHGARYPAGPGFTMQMISLLERADSLGSITPLGKRLLGIARDVAEVSHNQWGALDSLGMAEQRGIAARMFMNFPQVFSDGAVVNAISSYSPRSMMSMFSFVHQLDRLNSRIFVLTSTGQQNSSLMRPFDVNKDYIEWVKSKAWAPVYDAHLMKVAPLTALKRVAGEKFPMPDERQAKEWALQEYYLIAGLAAMSVEVNALDFFTPAEYNALWSCFNLRQYLNRCSSTLSTIPADIAGPLVRNLISTTDDFIAGRSDDRVQLRFGHAETLMPLLSLLRLQGCYYLTNYFDSVALHWKDFYVVPMAANLQMILFKSTTGRYYLRTDLNENPVPLIPGNDSVYLPWDQARQYMERCLPAADL